MITAIYNGNVINTYDNSFSRDELKELSKKKLLICPVCGLPYKYCHGNINIPYFRHESKQDCFRYGEPETQEHINGKIALFNWIKKQKNVINPELEKWLPKSKQRPDIYFEYNDSTCVIEYQCSPITTEYYDRTVLYEDNDICDYWILGTDKYFKKSEIEKSFRLKAIQEDIRFHYDSQYDLLFFDWDNLKRMFGNTIIFDTKNIDKILEVLQHTSKEFKSENYYKQLKREKINPLNLYYAIYIDGYSEKEFEYMGNSSNDFQENYKRFVYFSGLNSFKFDERILFSKHIYDKMTNYKEELKIQREISEIIGITKNKSIQSKQSFTSIKSNTEMNSEKYERIKEMMFTIHKYGMSV